MVLNLSYSNNFVQVQIQRESFDDVWPNIAHRFDSGDLLSKVPASIYNLLAESDSKIFHSKFSGSWTNWKNSFVVKFENIPQNLQEIYHHILLEYLKEDSKEAEIIKLSSWSQEGLECHGLAEHTYTEERFYLEAFLPRFQHVEKGKRTKVLQHLLQTCNDKDVLEELGNTACVTTSQGSLKKPFELVDEKSEIAQVFLSYEDVFPSKEFSLKNYSSKLQKVGMKHEFNDSLMKERALFINDELYSEDGIQYINDRYWKTLSTVLYQRDTFLFMINPCHFGN